MTAGLKLLMTADAVGGVWTYALDLAAALAPLGMSTSLAVLGPAPSSSQRREAEAIEGLDLIETQLPLDWTAERPEDLRNAGAAISNLAQQLSVDLAQLNSPALAADAPFRCPTIGVCHSCVATWWSTVKTGPAPDDFRWRTELTAHGLAACGDLVAPSRAFARQVAATHGVAVPRVVHNGRSPRTAARSPRRPIIMASGRLWDEGKNVDVLDRAAALSKAPVFAAGSLAPPTGGAHIELRHAFKLGRLSAGELDVWLARARVYASTALYEPFGLGVLEAAQSGCALVLSDIPTFRELWDGAAVFADPRSPEAFARSFEALIDDEMAASRLGEMARARAAQFTTEATARIMLGLYQAACGGRDKSAAA